MDFRRKVMDVFVMRRLGDIQVDPEFRREFWAIDNNGNFWRGDGGELPWVESLSEGVKAWGGHGKLFSVSTASVYE